RSESANAGRSNGNLEMGMAFSPYRRADRRFSFSFGGRYGLSRSTFVDPATGEVYAVTPDPNSTVEIPDRFDYDTTGAFLNLRWRVHKRVLLMMDGDLEHRKFVADYSESAGIAPLDDRSLKLAPGIRLDFTERVGVDLSLEWTDRRFEDLESVDENAATVADTQRHYRYAGGRAALRLEPTESFKIATGVQRIERSDLFADYYDSTGTVSFVSTVWSVAKGLRIGLDASERMTRYANATVDSDPGGVRRRGEMLRARGWAEKDLAEHVGVLLEFGIDRTDDRDPVYEYERNWVQAGARFRL
ncbi:MAG TPA: hypothetical protein VFG76_07520, partial [Candidatus Polarisedimenticolia bacterium]|nr:hypothetical protein [Candidatus Polarisedimenticolia bacterium]